MERVLKFFRTSEYVSQLIFRIVILLITFLTIFEVLTIEKYHFQYHILINLFAISIITGFNLLHIIAIEIKGGEKK